MFFYPGVQITEGNFPIPWELARVHGIWAGVNAAIPNSVVEEGIRDGEIPELANFGTIRREVPYGNSSRIDLLVERELKTYVEVKNVT
ncbi:MAG TPA: hypothetical protein ENH82_05190 [bacterium]|nr:hypothetical protein [bacterium]